MNKYNLYIILLSVVIILLVGLTVVSPILSKDNSKITLLSMDNVGAGDNIGVMLSDSNNKPISNANISIQINSQNKTFVTNNDGVAYFAIDSSGDYSVTCTYNGDSNHNSNSTSFNLHINGDSSTSSSSGTDDAPYLYRNGEYHRANQVDDVIDGWDPSQHETYRESTGNGYQRVHYDDGYVRVVDRNGYVVSYGYA